MKRFMWFCSAFTLFLSSFTASLSLSQEVVPSHSTTSQDQQSLMPPFEFNRFGKGRQKN
jgi:hypothetical protein